MILVSGNQMPVWASQDALEGLGQECQLIVSDYSALELVDGT